MPGTYNYFQHNLVWIRVQGFWQLKIPPTQLSLIVENALFSFNITCLFFAILGPLLHMIVVSEVMAEYTEDLLLVYFTAMGFMHLCYMKVYQKNFAQLIERMNDNFEYTTHTGLDNVDMKHTCKYVKLWCYLWAPVGFVAMQLGQIDALFHKKLSTPTYYPFININATPYFQILCLIYYVGALHTGLSYANIDNLLISAMLMSAQQFRMLSHRLRTIHFTALIHAGIDTADNVEIYRNNFLRQYYGRNYPNTNSIEHLFERHLTEEQKMAFEKELRKLIADCVRYHQVLVDICQEIDRLMSPVWFLRALDATLCISVGPFYAYQFKDINMAVAQSMLEYAMLNAIEFGVVCYLGTRLTEASDDVHFAVYSSPWHVTNSKYFNDVMQMMTIRSNRPIFITAGKFFVLCMQTFSNLLQRSFSFFTFMQNTREEN